MSARAEPEADLARLRRDIARIEGRLGEAGRLQVALPNARGSSGFQSAHAAEARLAFGIPRLDATLGGGLPLASLLEIRSGQSRDGGAVSGFALAVVARLAALTDVAAIVWIGESDIRRETGALYGPGLSALGLDPSWFIEVAVRTENEALWAFEAALACKGLSVVVCELRQAALELSATRRCILRAREAGVTGLMLRLGSERAEPSAAEIRFGVSPAPAGEIDGFAAGVGRMAWKVAVEKNRLGPTRAFTVEWSAHERSFLERGARLARPKPSPAASLNRPHSPAAQEGTGGRKGFRRAS